MFYLFEFDTRSIVAKSENGEDLAEFILDNELTLAFCVIESADDLDMELSDDEMNELYNNLGHSEVKGSLIEDLWEAIQDSSPDFKKFGKGVTSKLLKAPQDKPAKPSNASKSTNSAPRKRIKLNPEDSLVVVNGKCKSGSILDTIVRAIDEELCTTVGEVLEYITENHVIPKTGELADIKFAEHNVKYFLGKGNIVIEEDEL